VGAGVYPHFTTLCCPDVASTKMAPVAGVALLTVAHPVWAVNRRSERRLQEQPDGKAFF